MRWGQTPQVGDVRERIIFLWKPTRFYRRSRSYWNEDNGESIVLWFETVYVVEKWSYAADIAGLGHIGRSQNHSKCCWRIEAWRVLK